MSKTIPHPNYKPEPEELRNLKKLIAENKCACKLCADHLKSVTTFYQDKEIQVKGTNMLCETQTGQILNKNTLCPGCNMALNFFHRNDLKILKDQNTETDLQKVCNRSTEKIVSYVDASTSETKKLASDTGLTTLIKNPKQIENKEVNANTDCYEVKHKIVLNRDHCLCMSNFINSIRPPLSNDDIFNT